MKEPKDKRTKAQQKVLKHTKGYSIDVLDKGDEFEKEFNKGIDDEIEKIDLKRINKALRKSPQEDTLKPKKIKLGLGDAIEKIAKATGVKKIVEAITDDCGCDKRKEYLNRVKLPLTVKALRCLTDDQKDQFKDYTSRRTLKSWNKEDVKMLVNLYAHVFARQYNISDLCINCKGSGKILFKIDEQLEIVYNG